MSDVIEDRLTKKTIKLSEEGPEGTQILVLDTIPCPIFRNISNMKSVVNDIRKRNRSAMVIVDEYGRDIADEIGIEDVEERDEDLKVLVLNVAKCSEEERSRLFSRRFGYCNPDLLVRMNSDKDFGVLPKFVKLNEDNFVMDSAKFHKKTHSRTDPTIARSRPPWFRVYFDGYGGGTSMSAESYEGLLVDTSSCAHQLEMSIINFMLLMNNFQRLYFNFWCMWKQRGIGVMSCIVILLVSI